MTCSHDQLVERAARWLRNSCSCKVVFSEPWRWVGEQPAAIGWRWDGTSIVVECKVSVSDLHADRGKEWRRAMQRPMGALRYYLTPPGLARGKGLHGHGLLELSKTGKTVRRIVPAPPNYRRNMNAEMECLVRHIGG